MDSEHRHELEENSLARWLADKIEDVKPHLPAISLGAVAVVAGVVGWSGWKASNAEAKADRWRDFSNALEQGQPDLIGLQKAAEANPGTAVAEWAEVTWADGKLFEAATQYLNNRARADKAVEEAVEVYERLSKAGDRDVAERATYQLARALELQGKLDEAIKQYGRVTGAFAEVAKYRGEQLASDSVKASYEWITSTKTASATVDTSLFEGGLVPDDIELPEVDAADADATLDDLLKGVESEMEDSDAEDDDTAASEEATDESPADEPVEDAEAADKE